MDSFLTALTTSSFAWPLQFCLFSTIVSYVASVVTSNVSQVDRVWTFLPNIYTAYFALMPLWPRPTGDPTPLLPFVPDDLQSQLEPHSWSPRALLLLGLITTWMFRLSYNTYRRGLFSLHDEDYRWAILRAQLPPWLFQIVNLTFIAATQNVLLLTLGYPTYLALLQNNTPLGVSDLVFGIWAIGVLAVEFTSDNQQYVYQTYKHAFLDNLKKKSQSEADAHAHALSTASAVAWPLASPSSNSSLNLDLTPADAHRGFLTKGLWAYSRHPNFACEQSFWWIMCLIPLSANQYPLVSFTWSDIVELVQNEKAKGIGNAETAAEVVSVFGQKVSELFAAFLETILWVLESLGVRASTSPPTSYLGTTLSPQATETLSLLTGILPAILLSILFFSSTAYTENISKGKYPTAYTAYQKRVPMFGQIPLLGFLLPVIAPVIGLLGMKDAVGLFLPLWEGMQCLETRRWWYYLTNGEVERKRVDRLIWGDVNAN